MVTLPVSRAYCSTFNCGGTERRSHLALRLLRHVRVYVYAVNIRRNAFQTISLQDILSGVCLLFCISYNNDMSTLIDLNFHGGTLLNIGPTTTSTQRKVSYAKVL